MFPEVYILQLMICCIISSKLEKYAINMTRQPLL